MKFKLIKQKKEVKISPYKKIIGYYYLEDLEKYNYLCLHKELNKKELKNLKYLNDNNKLKLEENAWCNLNDIIKRLKKLGKNNKIILEITDKEIFNKFIFNESIIDYENLVVKYKSDSYYLTDYIYFESLLYKIVEPAKDLSPFEKYIYAYNIVKNFKEYKESDRKLLSRELYYILENEYIVCVGFCELLSDLLYKLNISNIGLGIEGKNKKDNSSWNHQRLYINIKDDKYGLNGFYVSDPTWDNDLEVDYYNHLALTNKEAKLECDFHYQKFDSEYEVFDTSSLEDLYLKINNLIEEGKIVDLLKVIQNLDINYYNYLKNKFYLKTSNKKMINELAIYIYNHINNEILGDTIMNAVEVVYRHSYGYKEEDLQDKLEEVRKINSKRQNCLFPSKIRVDSDTELDIIVLQNKFEKSSNKINKY